MSTVKRNSIRHGPHPLRPPNFEIIVSRVRENGRKIDSIIGMDFIFHSGIDAHRNENQQVDANTSVYDKMVANLSVETPEVASELVLA